ncbi:MAG: NUDIX hydrolase [Azospirillum sp.]|nr:NUDIX hydrolase [Azospirillum sp.]
MRVSVLLHPRPAAIAIVPRDGRVLLVRRANPPDPGRWGFPGGKIELGETVAHAAIRESAEETGVRAEAIRTLDTLDTIVRAPDGALQFHYVLVAVLCRWLDGEPIAADDVHEADWFDLPRIETGPEPFLPRVADLARRALV